MADTITFKETMGDDIFARAIWAALVEKRPNSFEDLGITKDTPQDQPFTIECKINGIEISLKGYLQRLEEHIQLRVRNRAREQLKDYLNDRGAGDRINTMSTVLEKFEKDLVAEFFPNDPDFTPNDR
jgi:hypothetical protein